MPYNSAGASFAPLGVAPIFQPMVKEPTEAYSGLSTAQCAANGALTSHAVTATASLVEAAKQRTKGMTLIVPTDQPPVTFANVATLAAGPAAFVTPINQTFTPGNPGFTVPSGGSIFVSPFNDPCYAITPTGVTATVYFIDT
jgi:hypothetical protein